VVKYLFLSIFSFTTISLYSVELHDKRCTSAHSSSFSTGVESPSKGLTEFLAESMSSRIKNCAHHPAHSLTPCLGCAAPVMGS
jgi:hypothetical protein